MPVTPIATIINDARTVLQEVTVDGTRWTNDELAGWLNEFYQAAVALKPNVSTVNETKTLDPGTKQTLTEGGLVDVVRNTVGNMKSISVTSRRTLDTLRRNWHSEPATTTIEQFVFDELDPRTFYVYPPADSGAEVELIRWAVPAPHDVSTGIGVYGLELFKLDDAYAPAATDYLLFRAFAKDSESPANAGRSQTHYQLFLQRLTGKGQVDQATSPNTPDQSANRPRGSA